MNVVYATIIDVSSAGNGGSRLARSHIEAMAADPQIEPYVVVGGPPVARASSAAFVEALGIPHVYIPLAGGVPKPEDCSTAAFLRYLWRMSVRFPWEAESIGAAAFGEAVAWAVRHVGADAVVLDYLQTALFVPPRSVGVPTFVTLYDREPDFYDDLLRTRGFASHGAVRRRASRVRLERFQDRTMRQVSGSIFISPVDMSRAEWPGSKAVVTPTFGRSMSRWNWGGEPAALFVGDTAHFPNRMAVEWITQRFAPALLRASPEVSIELVGAQPEDWPDAPANCRFYGRSTDEQLEHLWTTSAMLICPVANDYGVKTKCLDALARGVPVLGSPSTLAGLPFLIDSPTVDLSNPSSAAAAAASLLLDPQTLRRLAAKQAQQYEAHEARAVGQWHRVLSEMLEQQQH